MIASVPKCDLKMNINMKLNAWRLQIWESTDHEPLGESELPRQRRFFLGSEAAAGHVNPRSDLLCYAWEKKGSRTIKLEHS